jgi:pantoate--beta-alanine ligase
MELVATASQVRAKVAKARSEGKTIGFVPTMGYLHEGHLALMRRAREENGYLVISIFVNPAQFLPGEDYQRYPRDLERDMLMAREVPVDLVFAPAVEELYPPGDSTKVEVRGALMKGLCAPFRPGHFEGVATVVTKLFNIVQPDRAYFGEKDYQQLQVIKRLARDLHMPVRVEPVATVREPDGLTMSSRNAYLSPEERRAALCLSRALSEAERLAQGGEREGIAIMKRVREVIEQEPLVKLEYAELCDPNTLEEVRTVTGPTLLALAARVGSARLIDNAILLRRGVDD